MWYFVLILFLAAVTAVMILRVRVRVEVSGTQRRVLFVGLGRSGADMDLVGKLGRLQLFGVSVKSFELGRKKPKPPKEKAEKKAEPKKARRKRSLLDSLKIMPETVGALWSYVVSLIKATVVEELNGKIEAGFDEPDLTGMTFGYYQAALAAVPSVVGKVQFEPDWTGASFTGSMRVAAAIPLYKLTWRTVVLLFQLPLRKLLRVAIGKRRGDQDGQQRS